METYLSNKNCSTGLKVACFVLSTAVMSGCNTFSATNNQKEIISNNYWQVFYDAPPAQNTAIASPIYSNNSSGFADSRVYDLSAESNSGYAATGAGYPTTGAGYETTQSNSVANTPENSSSILVSSVQTALTSDSTNTAPSAIESVKPSQVAVSSVAAPTSVSEIITDAYPKVRPVRVAAQPSISVEEETPQQTAAVEVSEQIAVNASLKPRQKQEESAQTTEVASLETEKNNASKTFRWPVNGRIIAEYGPKPDGEHNDGINLAVPEGTPVKSSESGTVIYSGNELKGYGNLLLIRHNDGWVSAYAHNKELKVNRGDEVQRGDIIASAGSTGSVKQPQLHFELRKGNRPVNPLEHLPQQ